MVQCILEILRALISRPLCGGGPDSVAQGSLSETKRAGVNLIVPLPFLILAR